MSPVSPTEHQAAARKFRTIGFVAFDGFELLDLTGPMDAFGLTNLGFQRSGIATEPVYRLTVIAKQPGVVTSSCGLKIHADCAYSEIREEIDTLVIPGSPEVTSVLSDSGLKSWVRTAAPRVRRLVSICTGAFLLADIGLLDGRRATTHWAYCDRLAADYPAVMVEPDRIFLQDGPISTSGGITSGIDLTLALVEEDWGREQSLLLARYMVMFLKRPGGQSQFSAFLVRETTGNATLRALQLWIMEHPAEDLRIEILAERMAMSPRNFTRVFQTETGMTPAKFVEKVRIDAARHFLGDSDYGVEKVAAMSGFGDPERMRRTFTRHLGISPQDYRARFVRYEETSPPVLTEGRLATFKRYLAVS